MRCISYLHQVLSTFLFVPDLPSSDTNLLLADSPSLILDQLLQTMEGKRPIFCTHWIPGCPPSTPPCLSSLSLELSVWLVSCSLFCWGYSNCWYCGCWYCRGYWFFFPLLHRLPRGQMFYDILRYGCNERHCTYKRAYPLYSMCARLIYKYTARLIKIFDKDDNQLGIQLTLLAFISI